MEHANAMPTKRFFIENITRDISLEDAILDLIDNCVDSLIRTYSIDVSANMLLKSSTFPENVINISDHIIIMLDIDNDEFSITDNCGGIDINDAINFVFRFGGTTVRFLIE